MCSEVERRDIVYMATNLIESLGYFIVEDLSMPWQPWTLGSQSNEEYFGGTRHKANQRELSLLMLQRNLKAICVASIRKLARPEVRSAQTDRSNTGEYTDKGVGGGGVDARTIGGIVAFAERVDQLVILAAAMVKKDYEALGKLAKRRWALLL